MKKIGKKGLIVLAASGLLMSSIGFVGAQQAQDAQSSEVVTEVKARGRHGFGPGFGLNGLSFGRHLALGTELEVTLYDENPQEGGTIVETLSFTYGEDSEVAFAEAFAAARENAAYTTVNVGEQTRTLELAGDANNVFGPSLGLRGALPLRGLDEGSTVEATFYDGDPEEGSQVIETLSFTYGEDSEAGFANAFVEAAEEAAFVTITTSPQTYTIDLSEVPLGVDDRFPGHRGPGRDGHDVGPGRFR